MYLKSLEMQGFKSFPNKTKLNFDKGLTAVVGPNGSGKSNIADAVKWVLGEQSTKSLRGSKMEDVVFSGTKTRRAQGFAEVTLCLDNEDGSVSVNEKEIKVTRRYYRSGESEYKINSKSVRLKDVHELFMDTGLGRDGYSMVSQGAIEDIVSSKSPERREMFEEAAGISHYRYRRSEALKRLLATDENLVRLNDILAGLFERLEPLEKESEKAEEFLKYSEERKKLEIGIWLNTLEKSDGLIRDQLNKLFIAENQYKECEAALNEIINKDEEISQSIAEINVKIDDENRSQNSVLNEISDLQKLLAVNENSIEHNENEINRLNGELLTEDDSSLKIDEEIENAKSKKEQLNISLNEKNNEIESLNEKSNIIKSKVLDLRNESSKISDKIDGLSKDLNSENVKSSSLESLISEIENRKNSVLSEIKLKEDEIKSLKTEIEALNVKIKSRDEKIYGFTNACKGYMIKVKSKEEKIEAINKDLESLNFSLISKKNRQSLLSDMEKNMEGYQESVKSVMRASKRGALRGVCGPLSSLIKTSPEYTLSIETALGASIQNIATETDKDAKFAISYLKQGNFGRATFLPLNAIQGKVLNESDLSACAGFIDIASNLVTCDEKYKAIVNSLLGRTVITDNLDLALEIAEKFNRRFKIVTLDGQVINAGGSMTGGSKIKGAGFLSRANEIDKLSDEIKKDSENILNKEKDKKKIIKEYNSDKASLDGLNADILREKEEKLKNENELKILKNRLSSAGEALKTLTDETSTSEERLNSLKEEVKNSSVLGESLKNEIEKLSDSRKSIESEKESLLNEEKKNTEEINKINIEKASFVSGIESLSNALNGLFERKSGRVERLNDIKAKLNDAKNNKAELLNKIDELKIKSDNLKIEYDKKKDDISRLSEKRNLYEKESVNLRAEERKKTDEKEKLSGELVRLKDKKESLVKERDEIESKLYEEYKLTKAEALKLDITLASVAKAKKDLSLIKSKIKALGNVNVGAIDEYKEVSERYNFMKSQIDDVQKSKDELNKMINSLTEKMTLRFKERFDIINKNFSETFKELFGGGSAELALLDENDILECDIDIKAQPPGKNVKSMSLLSGGEKGLCAIALLFSILKTSPAPFCIFDEVEAALDDVNVYRYARYIKSMTKDTQFILITHRRGTMEEADTLYGVTMQEQGVSTLLELKTAEMAKDLGIS